MTTPFMPNYTPATLATHRLLNELVASIALQTATINDLAQEVAQLREELGDAFAAAPAAPAAAGGAIPRVVAAVPAGGKTIEFIGETLIFSYRDDGQPQYKLKGGQFSKHGVAVYPEYLLKLGIDAKALKPGPNEFNKQVIALMGDKYPIKVLGLAN